MGRRDSGVSLRETPGYHMAAFQAVGMEEEVTGWWGGVNEMGAAGVYGRV